MAWVLLFDGDCGFCNQSVRRVSRWDRKGRIHFASLQGKFSSSMGLARHLTGDEASVVMYNESDGSVLLQSDAVIQILRLLGGPWRLLLILALLPKSWRNGIYRCISRSRHRFSGNQERVCEMPDKRIAERLRE